MGSLDNWSSDERDGIMERSSRSRRSRDKSPSRTLGRSVSILSNLSEMSESVVFGTRWYLDEPEPKHNFPPRRIDDDWFNDDPSDDLGVSARASGSDESERPQRRRSIRADLDTGAGSSSSASTGSRPIAIPRSRQNSAASATTLPEALSARGERQGGYFPLHEDPQTRVRHTHPFYRDVKSYGMDPSVEEVDTGADADIDMPKPRSQSQYHLSNSTRDNDSYWWPSDDDEDSEPFRSASMGKYYPTVWEKRQAQKKSGRPVDPIPSSSRAPTTQSRTPRTPKYRPRPRTPVIVPRSTATTEPIPPLKLSAVE
ncbi:hypothetical protein BBK36DRAFT_1173836 [Trichoderma citrinoviride]|uniref:Uncharacterized protein n=1 Tax=Trichoderma citrinoviride TaxID=58853 RepID=A0A2T4BM04_9HYPO|nr:hypothetical protein BBK36DRAFT_1173836 [Trichoderma citrinoviride]PTB70311.1 hypothetical protein BBK36DRAFT_1173836 [Trichoderma citrinoviride]